MDGRKFQIGKCLFVHREKGLSLSVYVDDKNWLERNTILIRCGKYSIKKLIWENQHLSLIMCTWAALNDNAKQAKILWTITEPCLNRQFLRGGISEITISSKYVVFSSWSYDMAGHAKKCVERYCELANKTTQQLYKVSTPCIDDPPLQRRRNEICWRIVTSMLSNCSEMLILGTNWTT